MFFHQKIKGNLGVKSNFENFNFWALSTSRFIDIEFYSHFDLSSLISLARMQSAPRKKERKGMCRPGIEPGTFRLPGECSTTELPTPLYYLCSPEHILLNLRHPCMRCDASSDGRATALPVIYISSHFDLSSLISMARMQSAQRKKARKIEKVVTPARDRTGDLLITCQMRWPLRYWDHLISIAFCAILSGSSYCITVIHEWGWSIAMQRVLNQLGA